MALATQPTAEVTVTITGHAGTDLTLDKMSLTFTTSNWAMAQTVTVTAEQDNDAVDDQVTLTHTASGGGYASVTEDLPVTVDDTYSDTTAPQVTSITRQTPTTSPTNADSLTWRITFNEDVEHVDAADFTVSGTTATLAVNVETASTVYDVTVSGGDLASLDATVTLSFAGGQNITDTADTALTNTVPTGTNENSYEVDNTAPTVGITGVPATSSAPFTATFTFSEAVTGFVVGDIGVGNGTASDFMETSTSVYTALITPASDGLVMVDVAKEEATDLAATTTRPPRRPHRSTRRPTPSGGCKCDPGPGGDGWHGVQLYLPGGNLQRRRRRHADLLGSAGQRHGASVLAGL